MLNNLLLWAEEHGFIQSEELAQSDEVIKQMRNIRSKSASEAQLIVDRALAHYCEICDKGFANTGAARMHKRYKHS